MGQFVVKSEYMQENHRKRDGFLVYICMLFIPNSETAFPTNCRVPQLIGIQGLHQFGLVCVRNNDNCGAKGILLLPGFAENHGMCYLKFVGTPKSVIFAY